MDYFLATETWDLMDTVSEVEVGNVLKEKKSGMKYWFGCVKGQQTSSSLEGEALVFHIIQDYIVTIFFFIHLQWKVSWQKVLFRVNGQQHKKYLAAKAEAWQICGPWFE